MSVTGITSPYRGLAAFGDSELDGLLFFGRERETEVTTANVLASRLMVLYGPSGVGKSSLVRAGVARRLRDLGTQRAIGRGPDLACVVFASWADDPVQGIAAAIESAVRPLVSPIALSPPDGASLADIAEHWSEALDGDLCVVLDQFEEYFVYHDQERGPESLVAQLPELVLRRGLRVNVLLALRDDELARLGAFKQRLPGVFANARRLERLDVDSARAAILGPLQLHNDLGGADAAVDIEPELVDAVLAETAVRGLPNRIEAPYLQLVMQRIWAEETAGGSRSLRAETLRDLGGAEAIVRDHLDRALGVLSFDQQAAAARMFEHLVTPSGTKIAHREADLAVFARVEPTTGREVLALLGRERILRPLDDGDGGRYEIFHDVLGDAVLEWGRSRELDSERIRAKSRQRRLLTLAAAALAAVIVMVIVTAYALSQRGDARSQARHAGASVLAAQALGALATNPQHGLELAAKAARRDATVANEDVLRTALIAARGRAVLRGNVGGVLAAGISGRAVITVDGKGSIHGYGLHSGGPVWTIHLGGRVRAAAVSDSVDALVVARRRLVEVHAFDERLHNYAFRTPAPVRAVAISGRGGRVAVATIDGRIFVHDEHLLLATIRAPFRPTAVALDRAGDVVGAAGGVSSGVWGVKSGRAIVHATDASDVPGVALSPDGTRFATASTGGAALVRSVPGGQLEAALPTTEPLRGIAFSSDGETVVTRSRTGVARVFSVVDSHPIALLAGHADVVTSAAFSKDASLLVTGSADGTARLWDPGVAPELHLVARPAGCCVGLATGEPGTVVVAGGHALIYRGGKLVATTGSRVTAAAFSGSVAVTGSADGTVRAGGRVLGSLHAPISAVASSGVVVVAATKAGAVRVWAADHSLVLHERAGVDGLAVNSDGTLFASAGLDGVARIRDVETGELVHELHGHTKRVTGAAFSPDGTLLATSSADFDVRLWHVATGVGGPVLKAGFATVSGVAFSRDGRWLVTANPVTVGLYRVPTGTFVGYLHGHSGRLVGVGFAPDQRIIMSASIDGTVREYDCQICGTLPDLLQLADKRIAANR